MAKDIFHEIVKESLIAEGWEITHDSYRLLTELLKDALNVDIAAQKLIIATKQTEKIAVEVKSFLGDSLIYDFHFNKIKTPINQSKNHEKIVSYLVVILLWHSNLRSIATPHNSQYGWKPQSECVGIYWPL